MIDGRIGDISLLLLLPPLQLKKRLVSAEQVHSSKVSSRKTILQLLEWTRVQSQRKSLMDTKYAAQQETPQGVILTLEHLRSVCDVFGGIRLSNGGRTQFVFPLLQMTPPRNKP